MTDNSGPGDSPSDNSSTPDVPTIRLDQFLKICGIETGGQAKLLIQGGEILLNGEVETRRRKQLAPGDIVSVHGDEYEVELANDDDPTIDHSKSDA